MCLGIFNPCDNKYHAFEDFTRLNGRQKAVTCLATFFGSLGFGVGGVATFRAVVNHYQTNNESKLSQNESSNKTNAFYHKSTTQVTESVEDTLALQLNFQNIVERLFESDDANFLANKDTLRAELLSIEPIKKFRDLIKYCPSQGKQQIAIKILEVFFGLKPALIDADLTLCSTNERRLLGQLSQINPNFSVDFAPDGNDIAVNEKPLREFEPRKFLKYLPKDTIKESTLNSYGLYRATSDDLVHHQHLSYLLGFGPTFHVFDHEFCYAYNLGSLIFTDEHYRQIGEAYAHQTDKVLDRSTQIDIGKFFHDRKSERPKLTSNKDPKDKSFESGLQKYYLNSTQCIDEHTLNTDYWKKGIKFRDRLLQVLDLPYGKNFTVFNVMSNRIRGLAHPLRV